MPAPLLFGRYLLLDRLAVGGMAELFLAKATGDGGFEKVCVIKRVLPHLAADDSFVKMFLDEARIAARLEHPGIVQIFDLGKQDDDYYLAMEYLPGEDAASIFERAQTQQRPVPVDVACAIIAAAADALHYAHQMRGTDGKPLGIVHRDVSPANLFVTYRGQVKLLDFGIARAEERLRQTLAGEIKGKAGYMGPEQSRGLPVDRRADVWSLGVCLFELLAGRRLFAGSAPAQTVIKLLRGDLPSLRALRPEISAALEVVVQRSLAVHPRDRYQTALDLAHAVRDASGGTPQLDVYLTSLFGPDRAQAKLARATLQPRLRGNSTQPMDDLLFASQPLDHETLKTDKRVSFSRRWQLPAALVGLTAGAVVSLLLYRSAFAPAVSEQSPTYQATVRSIPPDAVLYLDGERLEPRTPTTLTQLSAGSYELRLRKDGYKSKLVRVEIGVGHERVDLEVLLDVDPEQRR